MNVERVASDPVIVLTLSIEEAEFLADVWYCAVSMSSPHHHLACALRDAGVRADRERAQTRRMAPNALTAVTVLG